VLHPSGKLPTPRRPPDGRFPKKLLANHEARGAELADINLDNATVQRSYLKGANLRMAPPSGSGPARCARCYRYYPPERLAHQTFLLQGATIPDGLPYAAYLRGQEGRKADEEHLGPS
jgi:uncharacterized protein YjbI with pentapeptide repeats